MAVNTTPIFQAVPVLIGKTTPGTLDTSTTAPTHTNILITGAADGTRISQIRMVANATLASTAKVNIFTKSGSTYTLRDQAFLGACTVSATSIDSVWEKNYEHLVLPSGVTLEITAVGSVGTGTISVTAAGWDYTP